MKVITENKKARFDYEFIKKIEAGIVLKGGEVKSIRKGNVQLKGSYIRIEKGEAWLLGSHIAKYEESNSWTHYLEERERKLLLHKKEIVKLQKDVEQSGFTIVPVKLYINKQGKIKIEIALAKGKQVHDKRETIKKRDQERYGE